MYAPREFYISNGTATFLDVRADSVGDDGQMYFQVTQDGSIILTIAAAEDLILAMKNLEAAQQRISEQLIIDEPYDRPEEDEA